VQHLHARLSRLFLSELKCSCVVRREIADDHRVVVRQRVLHLPVLFVLVFVELAMRCVRTFRLVESLQRIALFFSRLLFDVARRVAGTVVAVVVVVVVATVRRASSAVAMQYRSNQC
jgi:hypothetical protein